MGGGALSSNVSKLGSKEVSKKLRNFIPRPYDGRGCHEVTGEGESQIAQQVRDDKLRHPELDSGSQLQVRGASSHNNKTLSRISKFTSFTKKFNPLPEVEGKCGFTLAEVLITLGIIGVVASLTLPSVIMNYQKKQTVVELKKVYAELQNAIKLSEIDNGPMSEWNFPEKCAPDDPEEVKPFIEKYYLPYFKNAKLVKSPYKVSIGALYFVRYWVILDNGTIFGLHSCIRNDYIWLFVDLNGVKGPNKVGRDIFVFETYGYDRVGINKYKLRFWSYRNNENNIQALINHPYYGCRKDNTDTLKNFYCGRLIELNNWEIPADYPW